MQPRRAELTHRSAISTACVPGRSAGAAPRWMGRRCPCAAAACATRRHRPGWSETAAGSRCGHRPGSSAFVATSSDPLGRLGFGPPWEHHRHSVADQGTPSARAAKGRQTPITIGHSRSFAVTRKPAVNWGGRAYARRCDTPVSPAPGDDRSRCRPRHEGRVRLHGGLRRPDGDLRRPDGGLCRPGAGMLKWHQGREGL
jgi:hypothetical protein